MEYKIFKLKSGEEIITEVKEVSKGKYLIENPMVFKTTTMLDNMGRPYDMTMLKDWLIHSDIKTIELPKNHVATSFNPTEDTQKLYDLERSRIDNVKNKIVDHKKQTPDNLLEQLFGELFGDIKKEVDKQTDDEMNKIQGEDILPMNENDIFPEEPKDMVPMVSISMLFPPEVILDLLDSGILDPKELYRLVKKIEKMSGRAPKKAKKKPLFPKQEKLTESEKKVDDEPAGCNWKDWPENAFDLLNDGLTGA
jgi:hypothetical protein